MARNLATAFLAWSPDCRHSVSTTDEYVQESQRKKRKKTRTLRPFLKLENITRQHRERERDRIRHACFEEPVRSAGRQEIVPWQTKVTLITGATF